MTRTPVRVDVEGDRDVRDRAEVYLSRAWAIVPVPYGLKAPTLDGWQNLRLGVDDLPRYFNGHPSNIGVLLGEPSGGLIDVDLDSPEAVQLAETFLPATGGIFGRQSKPRSHWLYTVVNGSPKTKQYRDPDGTMLVEVRSTGGQTVFPGSTHPSGEAIEWGADGDPAHVERDVLRQSVVNLAVAAILARHWPLQGSRHEAAMAASGFLMRAGLDGTTTSRIVQAAAHAAGDEESAERVGDTATTANRLDAGAPATGGPRLEELLADGTRVVNQIRRWLRVLPSQSSASGTNGRGPAQAHVLVNLADDVELFHATGTDTGYAAVRVNDHHETWPVRSKGFRRWLVKKFFDAHGKPPATQALEETLGVIEARAQFEGPSHDVALRVGGTDQAIYLDLANDAWQVVEIDRDGWRVVTVPPLKFRRSRGMLALPVPERGGSIAELKNFINIGSDEQWVLFLASLCMKFRPRGPYPIDEFNGEQGAAKTTAGRVAKRLIDPNAAPLRAAPKDEHDLMIAARNNSVLAFDNVSHLPPWLSDAFCRLATGGGFATRELYSDADEMIFDAQRPVVLNGIEDLGTRSDFTDRVLRFTLPVISEKKRKTEDEFWAAFDAAHPRLLGALLDVVSGALRHLPDVHLRKMPRMADFAKWGTAVERALNWPRGRFIRAYTGNRDDAHETAVESSVIGKPLKRVVNMRRGKWVGTAGELLGALNRLPDDETRRSKFWPKTPEALSGMLRRLAPSLRATGWEVTLPTGRKGREPGTGRRLITLITPKKTDPADRHDRHNGHDRAAPDRHEQAGARPGPSHQESEKPPTSAEKPEPRDRRDGCDGATPQPSGRTLRQALRLRVPRTPLRVEGAARS